MTTLTDLVNSANESEISVEGGERYIAITGDESVTTSELKELEGYVFDHPRFELKLKTVTSVTTEIYDNIDGRFLNLNVVATFVATFEDGDEEVEDSFTIWIPEEDGESIEAGNFKMMETGNYTDIEPTVLDSILSRFEL